MLIVNLIQNILTILCLCIGFLFGFKLGKLIHNNNDNMPIIKGIDIKEKKKNKVSKEEERKYQEEKTKFEQIWENINNYNGDANNQRKVEK